jgi:hypothetical protein
MTGGSGVPRPGPAHPSVRGLLAVVCLVVLVSGCGAGDDGSEPAGWQALPHGPLGPRESALGMWTGEEILFVGGSDARPCPPTASCVAPDVAPLADGAAFDPRTRAWRSLAPAPVPFEWAQVVLVGRTAYLWVPGSPGRPRAARAFLAYDVDGDRWSRLPLPPVGPDAGYGIVRAGDGVVAYSGSDEHSERPDFVFDPAAGAWGRLPDDPLSRGFDRWMVEADGGLVLLDHELVPNPGSAAPSLTRAAAFALERGSWRRLPEAPIVGGSPWIADGHRVIAPALGSLDGGETNNWGRSYRNGGILDTRTGKWSELPGWEPGRDDPVAGVITASGAQYFGLGGQILNLVTGDWREVPPLEPGALVTGRTVVAAGRDMVAFGGARWPSEGGEGVLLNDLWMWSP